ncbi:MAG: methyltransferase [Bacteroidetes bacterium]|nr:methyltransferase [Bacteroidota bacterium]
MRTPFHFKQFAVRDTHSAMKVNTDGVLLGAWAGVNGLDKILEVGTGCGIITLMLAQRFESEILAIDVDEGSIHDARYNFAISQWADQLFAIHADFRHFAKTSPHTFDMIVSNPPFFSKSLKSPHAHRNLSRHDQSLSYKELIEGASRVISEEGIFSVILPFAVFDEFNSIAENHGFYLARRLDIIPVEGKNKNRILVEYKYKKTSSVTSSSLVLFHPGHIPTEAYKILTGEFYTGFER